MVDQARHANIPMPEGPLKCPRCDSTNTKFCYFNNYSLSQPRHFCKTCRRYWTRGGALRSVPVGGGCRRSKRSKGSSSKSPATSSDRSVSGGGGVSSGISSIGLGSGSHEILGLGGVHLPSLRLMPPALQYLTDFGSGGEIGMNNYNGIMMTQPLGVGGSNFSGGGSFLSVGGGLRLTHQSGQFPTFLGGSDPSLFEGSVDPDLIMTGQMRPKAPSHNSTHQVNAVKMENNNNNKNNNQEQLNLSRQFLGMMNNPTGNDDDDHQFPWNTGNAWTDLSGFSSSSTSNNNPP